MSYKPNTVNQYTTHKYLQNKNRNATSAAIILKTIDTNFGDIFFTVQPTTITTTVYTEGTPSPSSQTIKKCTSSSLI